MTDADMIEAISSSKKLRDFLQVLLIVALVLFVVGLVTGCRSLV